MFEEFQEIDSENILLKVKGKRNGGYQDVIEIEEKTLEHLVILLEDTKFF